jgi:hypothetical protein
MELVDSGCRLAAIIGVAAGALASLKNNRKPLFISFTACFVVKLSP